MKRMNILIVSLMLSIVLFGATRFANCTSPTVYLNPSNKEVAVGEEFDINIYVDYISHLYGYEVWLTYDKAKLNASSINNGGFLDGPLIVYHREVNNTVGYVCLALTLQGAVPGVTGGSPPPLATIHFKALAPGSSPIQFITNKTILSNDQGYEVACTTSDGTVNVEGTTHDIAVTNLKTSKDGCTPFPTVGRNYTLQINVTVQNQGGYVESFFDVWTELSLGLPLPITVGPVEVASLGIGETTTLTFNWDTAGVAYGNYTVTGVVETVSGETDTGDNRLNDVYIFVTLRGDINGDQFVNAKDAIKLGVAFGSERGQVGYNPNADINGDDYCNAKDAVILGSNFGKSW